MIWLAFTIAIIWAVVASFVAIVLWVLLKINNYEFQSLQKSKLRDLKKLNRYRKFLRKSNPIISELKIKEFENKS